MNSGGLIVDNQTARKIKHYSISLRYNMPAGYSVTALIKKLGITDKMKILLMNAPANYYDLLEANISNQLAKKNDVPDFVHVFAATKKEFLTCMTQLKTVCKANPKIIIWASWYKKSSGMQTDVTEDVIRNYALQNDLVDVKVCAVSEQWSGLKLVVPVAKR